MATKARLRATAVRVADLTALLARIGTATSGNKGDLINRLANSIQTPKLHWLNNNVPLSSGSLGLDRVDNAQKPVERILSVDMGIRNLAFCMCEVQRSELEASADAIASSGPTVQSVQDVAAAFDKAVSPLKLHVSTWRRIEVPLHLPPSETGSEANAAMAFNPANLSRSAQELMANTLLPLQPTTVLIERQRFRSAGAASILEWTVRVNSLESMLWAVLRTYEHESAARGQAFAAASEVNPGVVGRFWLHEALGRHPEKSDKIALVASWLQRGGAAATTIDLSFNDAAAVTRDAFLGKLAKKTRTKRAVKGTAAQLGLAGAGDDTKKLDDLADCVLQAAAWATWERNRLALSKLLERLETESAPEAVKSTKAAVKKKKKTHRSSPKES